MAARMTGWLARPALLWTLAGRLRVALRLVREPSVPAAVKAVTILPLVYLVSPIDVLPDVIPVLGQLDDLGVILLALEWFQRLCPPAAVQHHQRAVEQRLPYSPMSRSTAGGQAPPDGPVIEAEFRRG